MRHTYRPFAEVEAVKDIVEKMTLDDVQRLGEIALAQTAEAQKADNAAWYEKTISLINARSQAYKEATIAGDRLSWWRRWRDDDQDAAFASLLRRMLILAHDKAELGTAENDEALGWKLAANDTILVVLAAIELRPWLSGIDFDALMGSWREFMGNRQSR